MLSSGLTRNLTILCLILCAILFTSCSGYQLLVIDAAVRDLDDSKIYYTVSIKNAEQSNSSCKSKKFHGYFTVQAWLTDEPDLDDATIIDGAGGFSSKFMIPLDNAPSDKRTVAVGREFTQDFACALDDNFSIERTPYIIFTLKSSTESCESERGGTKGCTRYGSHFVIDLREVDFD